MRAPELPKVKLAGTVKADLSNQVSTVGLLKIPEPMRWGLWPPTPMLATSLETTGVKGRPLRRFTIPCTCQPPSTAVLMPPTPEPNVFPLPNGSAYPVLQEKLCGISKSASAFSQALIPNAGAGSCTNVLEKEYEPMYQSPAERRFSSLTCREW